MGKAIMIAAAITTIDHDPDPLHIEITPSVLRLIQYNEVVIAPLLPLMLAEDRNTRLRVQTVLEFVSAKQFGFAIGKGWPSVDAQSAWEHHWAELGNYSYKATPEIRKRSQALWAMQYASGINPKRPSK